MHDEYGFEFSHERPSQSGATLLIRIPAGINRKRKLLAEFARQLRFPLYFGWNWDAFEENLRDLSWLDGVTSVVLLHRDVPFARSPDQRETYLAILRDRIAWSHPRSPSICVIFPQSTKDEVQLALRDE